MYAIIESGGLQFKVSPEDILIIPKLDKKEGNKVSFSKVLFFKDGKKAEIGQPYLKGVKVEGKLMRNFKDKKVISYEYKRRKHHQKKKGFRRELSEVKIVKITT